MAAGGRDRPSRAHRAFAVAVEVRARPPAGRSHRALQGAALLPSLRDHDRAFARPDAARTAPLRRLRPLPGEALSESSELLAPCPPPGHVRVSGRVTLRPF